MNINYVEGLNNGDKEIAIKLNNTIQVTYTWNGLETLNRLVRMMDWTEQEQRILAQTMAQQKTIVTSRLAR